MSSETPSGDPQIAPPGEQPTLADVILADLIIDSAKGPKRVAGDSGSVEQHSIKDLIDADKHLNAKKAGRKGFGGLHFAQIVPDGTV